MNLFRSRPSGAFGGLQVSPVDRSGSWRTLLAAILCIACAPTHPLVAQSVTRSDIVGSVSRDEGVPLGGAFVILTEATTRAESERTTLSNGWFQFTSLVPGAYEVRIEALGYRPVVVTDVILGLREEVELRLSISPAPPLVTEIDIIRSGPTNTSRRATGSMQSVAGSLFSGTPRLNSDLGESARIFTSMDTSFGGNGLPGSESILFADGVPQLAVRHPSQRGAGFNHYFLPTSAVGSVDLLTSVRDVEWSGGAGRVVSASSTGDRQTPTTFFGSLGYPTLGNSTYSGDTGTSELSFWGGGGTSLSLGQGGSRLLLAVEGMRRREWRSPSLPASVVNDLAGTGGLSEEHRRVFGEPSFDGLNLISALARLDWQASDRARIGVRVAGGRYEASSSSLPGAGLAYGQPLPGTGTEVSAVTDAVWRISPRIEFEGRAGVAFGSLDVPDGAGETGGNSDLPYSYLLSEGVGLGLQPGLEGILSKSEFFASPMLHFREGANRVKIGIALRHTSHEYDHLVGSRGSYLFSSAASYLQRNGVFTRAIESSGTQPFSTSEIGAFVQYTWTPSRTMEFWAGIRADYETIPVAADSTRDGGWGLLTGVSRVPEYDGAQKLGGTLGIQWSPEGDGSTVLRGSASVRNGRIDPAVFGEYHTLDGEVRVVTQAGQLPASPGTPNASSPRRLALLGPELTAPRTFEAIAEGSQKVSSGTRIGISATYRRTDFLMRRTDLNRLPEAARTTADGRPVFGELRKLGSVVYVEPGTNRRFPTFDFVWGLNADGWSTYQGLTFTLDHEMGTNLGLFSSYTFSRSKDNWFGASRLHPEAALVPIVANSGSDSWDEDVSDFDVPHRAAIGLSWAPTILSGLRLTPVYRFSSGLPFTPMVRPGADLDGDGSAYNDIAVVPSRQVLGNLATDWSCLSSQSGTLASRNSCRAPSRHEIDLAIEMNLFGVRGSFVSLVVEGFNLTNSSSGLVDSSLLQPIADEPIVTGTTTVSVPLEVNPGFGNLLVPTSAGRTLRATLRIR